MKGKPNKRRGANDPKGTIKRLMSYIMEKHKIKFILVLVCIVLNSISQVASSIFLQTLIDDHITPMIGNANPVFTGLIGAIFVMAVIYIVGIIAALTQNLIMVTIAQGVQKRIRDNMFSHMQTLPIKYFDTNPLGDIMSKYTNDIDTLRNMLSMSIPQLFSSTIMIISVFAAMLYTSIPLTVLVVLMIVVMFYVIGKIGGKSGAYFVKQQASIGKVNGYVEEMMNGQKIIKVFCHEDKTKEEFDKLNEELCSNATNANSYANILMPIMNNIGYLQYVLIAIVGGLLYVSGVSALTLGAIASFLQLSRSFSMPISQVSMQLNAVNMALAGAERIFNLMDEKSEEDEGYVTLVNAKYDGDQLKETVEHTGIWAWKHPHSDGSVTYKRVMGDVRLSNVDFGYNEKTLVLKNINLYAEPAQKVAFVGATGAGKTTITNLLNRFYDIVDGKIRYDGININKIKKADLRRSLGIVLQDTHLFTGTVLENIRYGKPDATMEDVEHAVKSANAHHFISMLPDGYNTVISGDGSNLSQGQRQLISIVRAKVANLPVMILDEATSSIDTRTEAIVQRGMDALMSGRTVFVIAHRLSTVKNSDVIMVLEQGNIIERGSHDQLIEEKGKYYQLYTGAFELE